MKRVLLVLPSSTYRTHAFVSAALKLGVELIIATDQRQAMSDLVPNNTMRINFHDSDNIKSVVRGFDSGRPFDAVLGVDDISAWVAAIAATTQPIAHNAPEALQAARNKGLMRARIRESGLNSPRVTAIPVEQNPTGFLSSIDFPCVLKPSFLSASRGVTRANNRNEFEAAFERIVQLLALPDVAGKRMPGDAIEILVEDYIPGIEVALEGILSNGELKTLAIFDKPDPLEGPHFIETIYATPSRLPAYVQREITHTAHQAALAIGLKHGPIHAEIRVNDQGAWVVEIAGRSIGGLCSQVLRFDDGSSLEELIIRQALGQDMSAVQRERQAAAVMMIPVLQSGILTGVKGVEQAKVIDAIEDVLITIPRNQEILAMPEGGRYLGFIFARADLPEQAESAIREAHDLLQVEVMR